MKKELYSELIEYLKEQIDSISRFGFFVRGAEFQEQSKADLNNLIKFIEKAKKKYIKKIDEKKSNELLAYQLLSKGLYFEISMIIDIKKDNIAAAWDNLVNAQSCVQSSIRIGIPNEAHIINYLNRLLVIEKILFPPQLFASSGFIVSKSRCSLCDKNYNDCDHIKGMAYMGEMCVEIIEKIHEVKDISFVEDPFDKRCRAHSIKDQGVTRDIMTWRHLDQ